MNALFKNIAQWFESFPPEAHSYDPVDPKEVEKIQRKADEKLSKKKWITVERLGDGRRF